MFMTLAAAVDCFNANSTLIGIIQQNQFDMKLQPSDHQTLHCAAFNNTISTATLNYQEGGAIKQVQKQFQYYNQRPLNIVFDVKDEAIFAYMTSISIISYSIVLGEELTVNGTFQKIQHTLINTSNCWSDVTLVYNRSANSFLEITATPNDCLITTPKVTFQYQIGQDWIPIQIEPNSSSPAGGYKLPFVHMDTTSYQIFSETSPELEKQINTFFDEFSKNRQIPIRLSLSFSQPGSTLSQEIFGLAESIKSTNQSCIEGLKSKSIITISAIQNVADLSSLLACYDSKFVNVTSVFFEDQITNSETTASLASKTAIVFYFAKKSSEILISNVTGKFQQLYVSFMDENHAIIAEETVSFQPLQSCFFDIKTLVSARQTCIVLFPTLTETCLEGYAKGQLTRQQQILQVNSSTLSRVQYQVYQKVLVLKNAPYQKQCYGQEFTIKESQFPFYPGTYYVRQKAFLANFKKAFRPSIFITNDIDYQLSYEAGIDQQSIILVYFWIIISVCGIAGVAFTVVAVLKLQ